MFHNLKVRNFLNFMTVATIIVVIKFSVYNLPSTKKINDSAVYFRINNLLNGTCLIALS